MIRFFARLGVGIGSIVLGMIFFFLLSFSLPLFFDGAVASVFGMVWDPASGRYGLLPMVVGTLSVALPAALIALVLSLSFALTIDARPSGWLRRALYRFVQLVGSIPTVVYGLIGVLVLVPLVRDIWTEGSGMSIAAAATMLSLVVTPTMTLFFLDAFGSTPRAFSAIASALGGRGIQYQLYLLLPWHRRSIAAGFVLGLARAMGDTMIALMVAGNSIRIPHAPGDSVRTLTAHIALLFAGDFDSPAFRSIFASGLILFILSAIMIGVVYYLRGDRHA